MNSDFGCVLPLHQENLRFVKSAPALAQLKNSLLYAFISETLFGKAVACPLFCHLICTFTFQINLWQVAFLIPLKCFDSVYRPFTIQWIFSSGKLLITYLISCDRCQHWKQLFPKHPASLPAVPLSIPFLFRSIYGNWSGNFLQEIFLPVTALVFVFNYRYAASGELSSTNCSVSALRQPTSSTQLYLLMYFKIVMCVSNLMSHGELAG